LIRHGNEIHFDIVETMVTSSLQPPAITDIEVDQVDLRIYDQLLERQEILAV